MTMVIIIAVSVAMFLIGYLIGYKRAEKIYTYIISCYKDRVNDRHLYYLILLGEFKTLTEKYCELLVHQNQKDGDNDG